ncbi:S41 family peptidase [Algoriphagus sp. SE2]|uniref:S41 family peptidase n=1 Tax=Algoriphagus sp. SE2 TaxID=3141536 RepID=UPI0031CD0E18
MKSILILLTFFPFLIYGQDCDCESSFNWMKKTFEENDAGFQYIIDIKGEQAYAAHNEVYADKISEVSDLSECASIMNEWFKFFRKGHVYVDYLGESNSTSNEITEDDSRKKKEIYKLNDIEKFKKNLDQKEESNIEGIWQTSSYTIGIKREANTYIGFIIESEAEEWKKDEVKLKIFKEGESFSSIFYKRDGSPVESEKVALIGKNNLQLGNVFLSRVYPQMKDDASGSLYVRAMKTSSPFMERLNETTLYLRVPSFMADQQKDIDSVLLANRDKILSTENLILDIRYGTGGVDRAYSKLIPFLYTNPIRTVTPDHYSTPLNNQRMLDFSKNEGIAKLYNITFNEEERKEFKKQYDTLSQHIGEFVNLFESEIFVEKLDTVYEYPKNVAIVHNQNNGSSDEQFLLSAKQSTKVKLFGTTTHGVLDISNLNLVYSPCENFMLQYGLTKSRRIPEMTIDNIGIQPDYYITPEIPEYEWIPFVVDVLNEQ